tara:strand:- start:211 stop:1662 length:1452 start_codon:yes stop_codon:yes gene_type:complete
MAVKKIVKKSKPKKRTKRATMNQSVRQTVIVNQAPAPKRRRKSAPKKASSDKFGVPSSGLGVVTNLIEKIVNLQAEQSKVNRELTQPKQIESAPRVLAIEPPAIEPPSPTPSRIPSIMGSARSLATGLMSRGQSQEQNLDGFGPLSRQSSVRSEVEPPAKQLKSILSNPTRKVVDVSSFKDTKTTKAKPFFQSAMVSSFKKNTESKSNPTTKVDGLSSLMDTKTNQASSSLPEPLDIEIPKLKRQSTAERAVDSAKSMVSSVLTSISSKKKIEPKKFDELKTEPKAKKVVERKQSLDSVPDGSSGGNKPEKDLTTIQEKKQTNKITPEQQEDKIKRLRYEMEVAKEELDFNLDDDQEKELEKKYKQSIKTFERFKERVDNRKMGLEDTDAKPKKGKLLQRKEIQEQRGAEEPKKKIRIVTDKEKDEKALRRLKQFANDAQERYDKTQTKGTFYADNTIYSYRSKAKRSKEEYDEAVKEFNKTY